jgi:hypothetical protein
MPRIKTWNDQQLTDAVLVSKSIRNILKKLNLVPAGGNYSQITRRIRELNLDVTHFTGQGWNKNGIGTRKAQELDLLLVEDSDTQSHKLKIRLFKERIKVPKCELCGWAQMSQDGRIPVELDHINGDHRDNRLINLRILCPNCHSLQSTHRGRNKKIVRARMS